MNAVSGCVSHAPGERAPVGPEVLAVKLARVEDDLVHDLRDLDWVGGRTGAAALERARGRVRDVALVVRAVRVLAVPARREGDGHAPAAAAGGRGEALDVGSRARGAAEGALLHVGL